MARKRQAAPLDSLGREKLLERIASRYEQLDEKLEELEAKLRENDHTKPAEASTPRKPR